MRYDAHFIIKEIATTYEGRVYLLPIYYREEKLFATLHDKKRYVIYYRNLQQCTRHGLRITKIHILQFTQSPWLHEYIEFNTNFRTLAKNEFEKNLFKLINNAIFGETMKNVHNHVNVRLVMYWDGRYSVEARIENQTFTVEAFFPRTWSCGNSRWSSTNQYM